MTTAGSTLLRFTQSTPMVHAGIDWLAYFLGARVYFWRKPAMANAPAVWDQLLILGSTIFGAAAAAIALHDIEILGWMSHQPPSSWISGKSVLGGLLGGTFGTEIGKRLVGWNLSTGDRWVPALVVGLAVGRVGCQLSGTWDMTDGSPTGTGFGWDYGDGILRYPTALLEILAVLALWLSIRPLRWQRSGQVFNAFLLGYCVIRFFIEFLKPPFGATASDAGIPVDLFAGLTAIQWTALAGIGWMLHRLRATVVSQT